MEFLSPFSVFLTLSVTLSFFLSLFKGFKYYQNFNQTNKLPPGPWKLPFIGNIHQLVGGHSHRVLRDLSVRHGPLMHLKLGEIPVVIVSSPRLAKEVLKIRDPVFAGRSDILAFRILFYDGQDIVSHTYDGFLRQMRRIFAREVLSAKNVRSLAPIRLAEGKHLISLVKSSAGKLTNISERISEYTMSVICRAAFGKSINDHHYFVNLVREFAHISSGLDLGDLFPSYKFIAFLSGLTPKVMELHGKMDTFYEDIIQEHMKNFASSKRGSGEDGEDDLIDILIKFKDSNTSLEYPFTNANIKAMISNVFVGGSDTSGNATTWAMSELMRNPHVMAKAQAEVRQAFAGKESIDEVDIHELKYLNFVIRESLRLHPPLPMLVPRECMEDCEVDGYTIPAKTRVMINAWAIGRDPAYWPNPESFIPERFEDSSIHFVGNNFELLPFGSGIRICPGMALGVEMMELALAVLLHYFDWQLPGGLRPEDLDMTETFGLTGGRKNDLYLIPTLHSAFAGIP